MPPTDPPAGPEPSIYDLLDEFGRCDVVHRMAHEAFRAAHERRRLAFEALRERVRSAGRPIGVLVDGRLNLVELGLTPGCLGTVRLRPIETPEP